MFSYAAYTLSTSLTLNYESTNYRFELEVSTDWIKAVPGLVLLLLAGIDPLTCEVLTGFSDILSIILFNFFALLLIPLHFFDYG